MYIAQTNGLIKKAIERGASWSTGLCFRVCMPLKGVSVVDPPEQACQRRVPSACFLHTTHVHASGVPLLPERVQLARVASCDTML